VRLSFIFPIFLWLLLLLPPLWALTLLAPRRLSRVRFWFSLALRTCALLGLILALSGTQLVQPVGAVTTVFLLDGSDSVSLSQRARAETFIQQALDQMPRDDRAAIVVFGQRALVERTPSGERLLGQVAARPGAAATNVEDAIQLGLALLPSEGHKRLVLLSDGGANAGDALAASRLAAARGVPIDVLPLSGAADGLDAQVAGVELPAAAREGQLLRMKIDLESSAATGARLIVQGPGGATLIDQQVPLQQGAQRLEVELPEARTAFNRYVVRVEAPGDARPENNAAEAYAFVEGRPRALLVEGQPGEAANLTDALRAANVDVDVVAPARVPGSLGDLSAYDAVVLVDVPKAGLAQRAQSALGAYVHDLGRSLMMVGGAQSFGAGGWRDTPVEAALPVTMDIPSQVRFPPVSIVVLIDISGSMGAEENGRTKISLAAEGAQRIASLMRDEDDLTVIPFDSEAKRVIGPVPGSRRDEAIDALSRLTQPGGGGINIHDGLVEAAKYIRQSDKPLRHIITLTDGSDTVQQEGALEIVRQLQSEKVTLTSIAIGDGDHVPFIRDMAQVGAGRTFLTNQAANIPSILADETQAVIRPYVIEEDFTPTRGAAHPILRDFDRAPPLHGFVTTTPRQTAQVLLAAPRGEPVLAVWTYGLGRAVAWTSDFKGQWGKDWVGWDAFPRFSAQLLAWLVPPQRPQNLALTASTVGGDLVLSAVAQDDLGRPQTGLSVSGRMLAGDGSGAEVALREVGPGLYRAAISGARPGAYLVQIVARDAGGQPFGAVTAGAVVPPGAEYRRGGADPALLDALVRGTGGRLMPAPAAAFDPGATAEGTVREIGLPLLWLALLLLPFDVGVRRLLFGRLRLPLQQALRRQAEPNIANQELRAEGLQKAAAPAIDNGRPTVDGQPASRKSKTPGDLERLREAQERARRRARGEE
jgi:uncharacterized membrane protein/Mg-chelatase subunit ChlD